MDGRASPADSPRREAPAFWRWPLIARETPAALFLVLIFVLAGLPVLALLIGATRSGVTGEFTTAHLHKVFFTAELVKPLKDTLQLAAFVALLSSLLGAILAWTMSRLRPFGQGALEAAIMMPIFISPFIGAIGWITLGQPTGGMLNVVLRAVGLPEIDVFTFVGAAFTMALYFAPYAYALLRHSLDRLNPELEEAAAICGAPPARAVLRIVIPLLWPSLLSAFVITFILAAEMFSIPGLLLAPQGHNVLSYSIYLRATRWPINHSEAAAIGIILLLVTLAGMALYAASVRIQDRFITIGPRAARTADTGVKWGWRAFGLCLMLLFVLFSVVLPICAIAVRSLLPYFGGTLNVSEMSLENIRVALNDPLAQTALVNSLIVTAVSTVLLMILAFTVAVGRVRRRNAMTTATWIIASVPIAVPGVLIGVGLIWLYIRTPLYATLSIVVLVMLARFLPILVRMFETGLIQIGRELEQAAAICGARPLTVTRRVRLPLLAGTIRSSVTIVGTQVFNELTATALVYTSTSSVLPVVIFNYAADGDYSIATALALVQISLLVAGLGLMGVFSLIWTARRKRAIASAAEIENEQQMLGARKDAFA